MRRFLPWFILLFPAFELWLLIQVGKEIGALATIGLLVCSTMAGLFLLRMRGLQIARNMQAELAAGRIPGNPIIDTFCLMAAGWLFIFPGFASDAIAVLLLIPAVRRLLLSLFVSRMRAQGFQGFQGRAMHFESTDNGEGGSWTCTTFGASGMGPSSPGDPRGNAVIIDCEPEVIAPGAREPDNTILIAPENPDPENPEKDR